LSEWLQFLIDWEKRGGIDCTRTFTKLFFPSNWSKKRRQNYRCLTCNTGHVQGGKKHEKWKPGALQMKMTGEHVEKTRWNNGEKRRKTDVIINDILGKRKGRNGQPALDAKETQIRRELTTFYLFLRGIFGGLKTLCFSYFSFDLKRRHCYLNGFAFF
jgi:hypothetical protein